MSVKMIKQIKLVALLLMAIMLLASCGPDLSSSEIGNASSNTENGGAGNGSSGNGKDNTEAGGDSGTDDNGNVNSDDSSTIAKEFAGGDGSEKNPYLIKTAAQLRKLSNDCVKGIHYRETYFRLENDIRFNKNVLDENGELNGNESRFKQWIPIGKDISLKFGGIFNGNGHTIYGLVCTNDSYEFTGLFGSCETVTHLTIKDSYFEGKKYVGSIAGWVERVINCVNYATVKNTFSDKAVGGIAGNVDHLADFCGNFGKVYGGHAAGIAGRVPAGRIHNSFNYGTIEGYVWAGGIVSVFTGGAHEISNNVNLGVVSCRSSENLRVGGIASHFGRGQVVINVVNYGMILKNNGGIGALVGKYFTEGSSGHTELCHGYYWDRTSYRAVGTDGSKCPQTDVLSMKSEEMKSQSFLDKLNANVAELKEIYPKYNFCNWKFGKDGFPVLDWMN